MTSRQWMLAGATLLLPATQAFAGGPPCQAEMEADRTAMFSEADADANGLLTPDELKSFEALMRAKMADRHFQRIDSNDDGAVSLEELQAARPGHPGGPPPF